MSAKMDLLSNNKDFKNTHFAYRELSKIQGDLSLASFLTIRNEIKANAQSVHTTLGGGAHGHLGLVVTQQVYDTIAPGTPYRRPVLPTLQARPTDTQYVIAQKRHQYAEDMQLFRETNAVERAII